MQGDREIMLLIFVLALMWILAIWYLYDSYVYISSLCKAVINMFHHLKVGICENRKSVGEIIDAESVFDDNGARDLSLFLWENHEKLGISCDMVDSYNAFSKDCEFSSGNVCEEGITRLEKEYKDVLTENLVEIKKKYISFFTICTAVFAVVILLLV